MLRRILLASAGVVAFAGTAFALPQIATGQPAPIFTWTGPYAGLQFGGAFGYDDAYLFVPDSGIRFPYDASLHGVKGGGHVGYNYQLNQLNLFGAPFVAGLEGDVDGSSFGRTFQPFPDKLDDLYSTRLPIQGSMRGRGGFACAGYPILYYLTGGVAFADIRNNYAVIGSDTITVSNTRVGWTAGAGIEYAVTPNWSIRVEYRYTEFRFVDASDQSIFRAHHDLDENRVQIGVSFHPFEQVY